MIIQITRPIVTVFWEPGGQGNLTRIRSQKIASGPREGAVIYEISVNSTHPIAVKLAGMRDKRLIQAMLATELAIYVGEREPDDGARMLGGDLAAEDRPAGAPISSSGRSLITDSMLYNWWPSILAGEEFYDAQRPGDNTGVT